MRHLLIFFFTLEAWSQTTHRLAANADTVVVGHYDASTPPVLRVKSGDTVIIETLGVGAADMLEAAGVPKSKIEPAKYAIAQRSPKARGHFLTGPVFIEGAEPGDVLEVDIIDVKMTLDYAYNGMGQNGVLADLFADRPASERRRIIPLDRQRRLAPFAPGIEVPLRPFFGSMGVAPPSGAGRVSSSPPGRHAGNLDNRELIAGTKLFIPVFEAGALFQVGDGHAAQADGEADQTGLETSLTGTFRFTVRKNQPLTWPRGETPTHWIAMGLHQDVNQAIRLVAEQALEFLTKEKKMKDADAYMLMSVGVDLRITQLVDGVKGVHAMIPKSLFTSPR
ncbi:MAG: acetamidase/formamidase family protein [Bryobacteraceae bacterium]|nr:acetamidase/formamidase family protein [Bryobacteraceae bacterium]